jgi:RNA polymerase sigma-70 factor (ECF subfamily)
VTDADLVARAREGDPVAFGELVDRHRTAVYRAALSALGGSHAEAEDAAQEACLIAFRRLASFRGEASFKTWLLTIAWNEAITRRRRLTRMWRRLFQPGADAADPDAVLSAIAAREPTPEQHAVCQQLRQMVARAIHRLSPKLRDALLLAQSGAYTYEEIGAMLRVPVGTIKWRVSEARRRIKQHLREGGVHDVG